MIILITRSTMVHSSRVEMTKSIGAVVAEIALYVNVKTMEARIKAKNSAVDLCFKILMGVEKMHLPCHFTIAIPSKCANSINRQACPDQSNENGKPIHFSLVEVNQAIKAW